MVVGGITVEILNYGYHFLIEWLNNLLNMHFVSDRNNSIIPLHKKIVNSSQFRNYYTELLFCLKIFGKKMIEKVQELARSSIWKIKFSFMPSRCAG